MIVSARPAGDAAGRPAGLGPSLRPWRLLSRIKQTHAAERFGVTRSTISRWEAASQRMEPSEQANVEAFLSARLDAWAEQAFSRMIRGQAVPARLLCDLSHRLRSFSEVRAAESQGDGATLMGCSMRPSMTEELARAEAGLPRRERYHLPSPPAVEADAGASGSVVVAIRPSRVRWTRLVLFDGSTASLVETIG